MGQFSTDDMALLESTIANNFEDALMIGSLSKLQQHQLHLSEKLNTILSENVIKAQTQAQADKLNPPSITKSAPSHTLPKTNLKTKDK